MQEIVDLVRKLTEPGFVLKLNSGPNLTNKNIAVAYVVATSLLTAK